MTKLKRYELRAYVTPDVYHRLEKEMVSRGRDFTMSKTVRDCLMEYLNVREELATAFTAPGKSGEAHTGKIIHTLLARSEERLAATIEHQEERINELHDQMMVMTAMMDRLYVGVMQHLPEIPPELAKGAVASANRRHHKWLTSVEKLLSTEKELPFSKYETT